MRPSSRPRLLSKILRDLDKVTGASARTANSTCKDKGDLAQLPEQSRNHVAKASKIIGDFIGAVEKHLEGAPGRDGLHQSIRESFRVFTTAVRASAPDFRPYPSSATCSSNRTVLPYHKVEGNNRTAIYLDEVKELASM